MDRIIFAWDCDAGFVGHVKYALGKVRGRSCSLCDLSYAGLRPSNEFEACRASLPVPIVPVYRDELSPSLAAEIGGAFPSVVLDVAGKLTTLLGPGDIASMKTFAELEAALRRAVSPANGQSATDRDLD